MQPLIGLHASRHSFSPWISPGCSASSRTSPTLIPPPCKPWMQLFPFPGYLLCGIIQLGTALRQGESCFTTPEPCPVGHWENPSLDSPSSQKDPSTIMFIQRGDLSRLEYPIDWIFGIFTWLRAHMLLFYPCHSHPLPKYSLFALKSFFL